MLTNKRSTSPRHFVLLFAFAFLLLVPVVTVVAQIDPVRTSPTQAPTATMGAFQANPTQPPKPDPIDDFRANPTNTPTPRPPRGPDDVVANPTDVPRGPDDLVANPTDVPEREIDDVVANPTNAPETVIDDFQANPTEPGTLTVRKWVCPAFYDPLAGSPLDDCAESLDGVTFSLDNHDPGQPDLQAITGDVIDGAAVFEPQPGVYSLIEEIPAGYDQPFLWDCTGLDNPAVLAPPISTINFFRIVIAAGQDIECDWMNVIDSIDDVEANPGSGTVRVVKRDCPVGVVEDAILSEYLVICTEAHNGVEFTLDHGGESDTAFTASSEAMWTGVLPGAFEIQETMPDGYGDPIVFCGFTESPGGGVQHPSLQPSGDGLVTGALAVDGAEYVCYWMNVPGDPAAAIDDVQANPTEPS